MFSLVLSNPLLMQAYSRSGTKTIWKVADVFGLFTLDYFSWFIGRFQ